MKKQPTFCSSSTGSWSAPALPCIVSTPFEAVHFHCASLRLSRDIPDAPTQQKPINYCHQTSRWVSYTLHQTVLAEWQLAGASPPTFRQQSTSADSSRFQLLAAFLSLVAPAPTTALSFAKARSRGHVISDKITKLLFSYITTSFLKGDVLKYACTWHCCFKSKISWSVSTLNASLSYFERLNSDSNWFISSLALASSNFRSCSSVVRAVNTKN